MSVIGFLPDEISSVLELLAAILNLGNITFSFSGEVCKTENKQCKAIEDEDLITSSEN